MVYYDQQKAGGKRMSSRHLPNWNRISIRIKLALIISLQMVLLVSMCMAVLFSENQRTKHYYEANTLQSAVVMYETISNNLEALYSVTAFPVHQQSGYNYSLSTLLARENSILNNYEFQNYFRTQSRQMLDLYDFIDTIIIYNIDGEGSYFERARRYEAMCRLSSQYSDWVNRVIDARGGAVIFSAEDATGFGIPAKEGQLFGVARSIINTDQMRSVGMVIAGFSPNEFKIAFDSVRLFQEQEYGIFNGQYFLAGGLKDDAAAVALIPKKDEEVRETVYTNSESDRYMYNIYQRGNGITVIIRTPMSAILEVREPSVGLLALLIVVLVASIYIIHSCTNGILRPIQGLIDACVRLEQLDSFVSITGEAPAEINRLYRTFNHMSRRIHTLVHEVLMQELAQNKLELQMLRTQISPHYLCNTLESMRMNAYTHGNMQVAEMAEMLAHNLQYILRGTNHEVLVKEEMDSILEYMRLISIHDHGRICPHIDIVEEALNCYTIKLVLQPLVENAIYHGLKDVHTPLNIDIHGYLTEDTLYFVVSDDGKGIASDQLESLKASLTLNNEQSGRSIGIKNLHRRLALYYGEDYGVELRSIENVGTTVIVRLPMRRKPRKEERS